MFRTELANGIRVLYEADTRGTVILQYPDGAQVQTTGAQLELMSAAIEHLREMYQYVLRQAGSDTPDPPPVEKLADIDGLLMAMSRSDHRKPKLSAEVVGSFMDICPSTDTLQPITPDAVGV